MDRFVQVPSTASPNYRGETFFGYGGQRLKMMEQWYRLYENVQATGESGQFFLYGTLDHGKR